MKLRFLLLLNLILIYTSYAQQKTDWIRFENTDSTKVGYKDAQGVIKMEANLETTLAPPKYFDHIIPIYDYKKESYYLLKNGQKVAIDSLYLSNDFELDCERENTIRFQNKKSHKIGFLDQNGRVIVPAIYDYASPFYNKLAVVLKNAQKHSLEKGHDTLSCNHLSFHGGVTQIINDKNQLVIDSIDTSISPNLNWYSLKITSKETKLPNRVNFKGVNGQFYSFIDYDAEFKSWFYNEFISIVNKQSIQELQKVSFAEITTWSENDNVWKSAPNSEVVTTEFSKKLLQRIQYLQKNHDNSFFTSTHLNPFIYESEIYDAFYDCNDSSFKEKYPVYGFYINYVDKNQALKYQESFDFIKTDDGYKLFTYSFKN